MSTFIVRIELHGANDSQYDILHAAMESLGFRRYVLADNGKRYQLPDGEYAIDRRTSPSSIRDYASQGADRVGCKYRLLATKSDGIAWYSNEYHLMAS